MAVVPLARHVGCAMVRAATAARSARRSPRSATAIANLARSARRERACSAFARRATSSHRTAAARLARLSQRVAAAALRRELYADWTTAMIRLSLAFGVRAARSAFVSRRTTAKPPRWSLARTRRHRSRAATRACRQLALLLRLRVVATVLRWGLHAEWTTAMVRLSLVFGVRAARSALVSRWTTARILRWSSARTRRHCSRAATRACRRLAWRLKETGGGSTRALKRTRHGLVIDDVSAIFLL